MKVKDDLFERLREFFNWGAATPKIEHSMDDLPAAKPRGAKIFKRTPITDPAKHIEELSAARKPHANVPFDVLD
jgi:hypothetical protein